VGLLGGIIPEAVLALFLVTVGLTLLGCTLAMAFSVRVLKAHEVLMAVYAVLAVWLISLPIWFVLGRSGKVVGPPAWYTKLNPYVLAFAPFEAPGYVGASDLAVFLAVMAGVSGLLTLWSVSTLRREVTAGVT